MMIINIGCVLVVVCLFSNTRETSREFLTAANAQGMPVSEYAYVFPWLQVREYEMFGTNTNCQPIYGIVIVLETY